MINKVPLIEQTATGNPVSFTTAVAKPLISCQVAFSYVRDGSGEQSPENVRMLTGWNGLNIYHSGEDTSNPAVYPVTWSDKGMLYGGTLDLVTGVLTANKGLYAFTGLENWRTYDSVSNSTFRYSVDMNSLGLGNKTMTSSNSICSHFAFTNSLTYVYGRARMYSGLLQPYDPYGKYWGSLENFKNWLKEQKDNNTPVQVCFPINDKTYEQSPQQFKTLRGVNTIWSDVNDNLTVTYLVKSV